MRDVLVSLLLVGVLSLALMPGAVVGQGGAAGALAADQAELEQRDDGQLPEAVDELLAKLADHGDPCWREAQARWNAYVARVAEDPARAEQAGDALAEVIGACDPE